MACRGTALLYFTLLYMDTKTPSLKSKFKASDKCRKKLYRLQLRSMSMKLDKNDSANEINIYSRKSAVQSLSESLQSVGELPV
jgi:hypothetical protein